jgi:hypothetical protein
MSKRNFVPTWAVIPCLAIVAIIALSSVAFAEVLTMSPHKIVLNAQGQFEDVQAVIRMPMQAGYTLSDYQVTLSFNGIPIIQAFNMRYCYIDDNFLASFDRMAVQNHPTVIGMANTMVTATVAGWYSAVNSDGNSYTHDFSWTDDVEIVAPGR